MKRAKNRLIFISYRRADTDALAGRLRDRMLRSLRGWDIFVDVNSIPPGEDYKRIIDETLPRASVFVLLIGKQWLGPNGTRLHEPNDMVRYEIRLALAQGVRIVPVVVNQVRMPAAHELPDDVAALATRNASELRHTRFDDDFAHLVKTLTGSAPVDWNWDRGHVLSFVRHVALGMIAGAVLSVAALIAHFELTGESASDLLGETGATLLIPLCAILGGVTWRWAAARRA